MKDKIHNLKECPECKANWDGGDVLEMLEKSGHYNDKTKDEMIKIANNYGWTPENKIRSSNLIGIEIQGGYDGISYWRCPECNIDFDRWTGKIINQ